jgi:pimeloyl-ACP methyl ester carboxylesterase
MAHHPLVLVHGYSDSAGAFRQWESLLTARGRDVTAIHAASYRSLTNEVTIRDIAEGFDRALAIRAGLDGDEPFDAIVHSTGMLVVRAWLTGFAGRRDRLKHLVCLAPATFGSPLAHKGRSWLGALFKGEKRLGPDFLEAGDRILDGLELASRFSWDLAHEDLLGEETFYGPTKKTPFVFVFCGAAGYSGIRKLIEEPGTDGVVRWAGCALNTRKIILDLTVAAGDSRQIRIADWKNVDIPMVPVKGRNHGSIVSDPGTELVEMVESALDVSSAAGYAAWHAVAARRTRDTRSGMRRWQQFIIRALDERGDPITDYNVQLYTVSARGRELEVREFDLDVHTYREDASLRCFHVDLDAIEPERLENLWLKVMASSGSELVGYHGTIVDSSDGDEGKWSGEMDLSPLVDDEGVKFFYPFTTTLVELRLNREPMPLEGVNRLCWF